MWSFSLPRPAVGSAVVSNSSIHTHCTHKCQYTEECVMIFVCMHFPEMQWNLYLTLEVHISKSMWTHALLTKQFQSFSLTHTQNLCAYLCSSSSKQVWEMATYCDLINSPLLWLSTLMLTCSWQLLALSVGRSLLWSQEKALFSPGCCLFVGWKNPRLGLSRSAASSRCSAHVLRKR